MDNALEAVVARLQRANLAKADSDQPLTEQFGMSSEQTFVIPRASDRKILQVFEKLNAEFGSNEGRVYVLGHNDAISLSDASQATTLADIRKENGSLIRAASAGVNGFFIRFARDDARPALDRMTISFANSSGSGLPIERRVQVVQFLTREFQAADPAQIISGASAEITADLIARQQAQLDRLVVAHAEQMARMSEHAASLQADYSTKIAALDKEAADKRVELDNWYQDKELELSKEREEFEAHKKSFDDRANTHVRRQLRTSLNDDIRKSVQQFQLSRPTRQLRWPVHVAAIAIIVLLGVPLWRGSEGFLEAARAGNLASSVASLMAVKLAANAVGLGAVVWFYLRFLARWSEKHANEEFQLRQLQFDVDRASWAVEAAFEWQQQKGEPMPAELLQSVTHGLFWSLPHGW